jgi:hypothetical protein
MTKLEDLTVSKGGKNLSGIYCNWAEKGGVYIGGSEIGKKGQRHEYRRKGYTATGRKGSNKRGGRREIGGI